MQSPPTYTWAQNNVTHSLLETPLRTMLTEKLKQWTWNISLEVSPGSFYSWEGKLAGKHIKINYYTRTWIITIEENYWESWVAWSPMERTRTLYTERNPMELVIQGVDFCEKDDLDQGNLWEWYKYINELIIKETEDIQLRLEWLGRMMGWKNLYPTIIWDIIKS